MTSELIFILATVTFFIVMLGAVMGGSIYYVMNEDKKKYSKVK